MWSFAIAFALLISGIILDNTSYLFVFCLTLGIHITCLLYLIVFIKEVKSEEAAESAQGKCKALVVALNALKEGMQNIIRKRDDNGRIHIIALLCLMMCIVVGMARK